jgi:hypothetical protein
MVRQSVIYQSILLNGWRQGSVTSWRIIHELNAGDKSNFVPLSQVRIESEVAWIEQKLIEEFETIDEKLIEPLRKLSIEELEALSEEFTDLLRPQNVEGWLDDKIQSGCQPWFYQSIVEYLKKSKKYSE